MNRVEDRYAMTHQGGDSSGMNGGRPAWGGTDGGGEERETFLLDLYEPEFQHNEDTVVDVKPMHVSDDGKPENAKSPSGDGGDKIHDDWDEDVDDDDDDDQPNFLSKAVMLVQYALKAPYAKLKEITKGYLVKVVMLLAYVVYLVMAIIHRHEGEDFWRLIACTILGIFLAIRFKLARFIKMTVVKIYGSDQLSLRHKYIWTTFRFFFRWFMYGVLASFVFYVMYVEGLKSLNSLRSLPGLIIVLIMCLLMSNNPKKINWHTIYVSVGLQFLCAFLFLKWNLGKEALYWVQERLDEFFANSKQGSLFLFGETYEDHYMVFGGLPIILLMGATMSVLYYVGAMQVLISGIGSFLSFVLDTDPIESTGVAAGIFMEGITAILTLKPFLIGLSKSQLFLIMTSAFASLGGAFLGVLVEMGIPLEYLLPAMMISAPATFAVCKLIYPEKRKGKRVSSKQPDFELEANDNIFDALQQGAVSLVPLLANIICIVFVFMTVISWVDNTVEWFGDRVGIPGLSMAYVFSYILYPIPLAMGIEAKDCHIAATLWGYRITSSNFIAFLKLVEMRANRDQLDLYLKETNNTGAVTYNGADSIVLEEWNKTLSSGIMSLRSEAILTYSLCGFSSILSVGISLGVFYTLLPQRKPWLVKIPFQALLAGNITNLMTGCFASFFY